MDHLVRKCRSCGTQYPSDFALLCEVDFEDSWIFWCQKHGKPAEALGCEDCAYKFSGKGFLDYRELGEQLFLNWTLAKRETERRKISDWLSEIGRDRLLAGKIREVERMDELSADDRFALVVMLMHGDGILRWRDKIIEFGSLQDEESLGVKFLSGPLPDLLAELGLCTWLYDVKQHWKGILEALPSSSGNEIKAFQLLFNTDSARDLSTALTIAAHVPRFNLPSSWVKKPGALAKMAANISDDGFSLPSHVELKALFGNVCRGLRAGALALQTNKEYYDATLLLAWPYEGKSLLENDDFRRLIKSYLHINQDLKLLKSLIFGYLRDFDLEKPTYVSLLAELITIHLQGSESSEFQKWRAINNRFQIFSGIEAPTCSAKELQITGDVEASLNEIGLHGSNLWGGFSAEILLEKIHQNPRFDLHFWDQVKIWFEKCMPAFVHHEHYFVDTIAAAYQGQNAEGEIRRAVSRYLVDRFGEPDATLPMWADCLESSRDLFNQWLFFENLERFFDVIATYAETTGGEMRSQWSYRKSFWLAVHRTGAVTDLRIAAGKGLMDTLGESRLKDRFGSKLVKLNDSDERRCALILQLGPITIVDFTHNAKCRIWKSGPEQIQWFKGTKLSRYTLQGGDDMRIRSHYESTGIAHFSSETYGWQDALAEFLRSYLPAKLPRSSYQYTE